MSINELRNLAIRSYLVSLYLYLISICKSFIARIKELECITKSTTYGLLVTVAHSEDSFLYGCITYNFLS